MILSAERLARLTVAIFEANGSEPHEARAVSDHLVDANLAGHDSHGVIRVRQYLELSRKGAIRLNHRPTVVLESEAFTILDGGLAFGQVVGLEVVRVGVEKAAGSGIAVVGARNASHVGRVGAYAEKAAESGLVSVHFSNSTGNAMWAAPFRGRERRLSASPIAAGFPVDGQRPMILDFATTRIAEGKARIARNAGTSVPDGCIIDADGRFTTDPEKLYGPPPGALVPFGEHKGYGLNLLADLLAGAITGGGCTHPDNPSAKIGTVNGMLSFFIEPDRLAEPGAASLEARRFIDWVKSSAPIDPSRPVEVPGEYEAARRAERLRDGIPIDDVTWSQLLVAAEAVGIGAAEVQALTR